MRTGCFQRPSCHEMQNLLFICSFGCLQRIYFLLSFLHIRLEVGGRWTFAGSPFGCRIGINPAVDCCLILNCLCAALAFVNYRIAMPTRVSAPLLRHESAFGPFFDCVANHSVTPFPFSNYSFFNENFFKKPTCFPKHSYGKTRSADYLSKAEARYQNKCLLSREILIVKFL